MTKLENNKIYGSPDRKRRRLGLRGILIQMNATQRYCGFKQNCVPVNPPTPDEQKSVHQYFSPDGP